MYLGCPSWFTLSNCSSTSAQFVYGVEIFQGHTVWTFRHQPSLIASPSKIMAWCINQYPCNPGGRDRKMQSVSLELGNLGTWELTIGYPVKCCIVDHHGCLLRPPKRVPGKCSVGILHLTCTNKIFGGEASNIYIYFQYDIEAVQTRKKLYKRAKSRTYKQKAVCTSKKSYVREKSSLYDFF